ncbi:MAG TPA: hypothetical protein VJ565_01580 [Dehalococcoidia bacterium]|nr:hypothetical protein [Dehalococcoidia bacterium]
MTGLKVTLLIAFVLNGLTALGYIFLPGQMAEMKMGPQDVVSARYAGAILVGLSLALLYASSNPHKNVAIVRAALAMYVLPALVGLYHGLAGQEEWGTAMISIVVGGVLALGLALFYPMGAKAT